MENKVVIYSNIHKGQRVRLYKIAMQTGTLDFADQEAIDSLYAEATAIRDHIRLHVSLEEKIIHPILTGRFPGEARKLEEDHRSTHQELDDLMVNLDAIKATSKNHERRREMLLEFYRGLNRFISGYLVHINKEEELIQPALWAFCTTEELLRAFKTFLASQTIQQVNEQLQMMLTATNLYERADVLYEAKANAPPEMFQAVLRLAQQVLAPNDWEALKTKLNIQ